MQKFVPVLLLAALFSCKPHPPARDTWTMYNGSQDAQKYSSLAQIDTSNVSTLRPLWTYHTGDADTAAHSEIQCNPLIIDSTLYATTPQLKLIALEALTGKRLWQFNPFDSATTPTAIRSKIFQNTCRGITYWTDGKTKHLYYTAGPLLLCVNAATGRLEPGFGQDGAVDLHQGLGARAQDLYVTASTAGMVYKDLLIMGCRVSENAAAAPGYIRAYDLRTGAIRWTFHTIPQPGEPGYETWDDSTAYAHIGGANVWSGFSLDEKRGLLFCPVGSPAFDFYGGKRHGSGLYGNCLLALDAATGKHVWHFQGIHHDVWDRDFPNPPVLLTIHKDGKPIDVAVQTTKTGFIFVLERATGKPVYPVEEMKVDDQSTLEGEKLWPTQPTSSTPKPFVRQHFTPEELNPLLPDSEYAQVKRRLDTLQYGSPFLPPSTRGTVVLPGFDGGAEWGGPAADPTTGMLYLNANEMAWVLTMTPAPKAAAHEDFAHAGARLYRSNCMACHGPDRKGAGNYPSLINVNKKYNLSSFLHLINTGRRMMPAFTQLDAETQQAIASYILELPALQKKTFSKPATPPDAFQELPYTFTGYNKFLSKSGAPALRPPWGTLSAIDLNTGRYAWQVPLGEDGRYPGQHTGTENYGAPVATAGGLLFIGATRDSMFRAFSQRTGKVLWQTRLPAPAFATPAVAAIGGRQYVFIACGGGKLHLPSNDVYMAFALPQK